MSKRQDREQKTVERLEKENRTLKQINRSLLKQVKKLNRGYKKFMVAQDEGEVEDAVENAKEAAKKMCFSCSVGEYREVIVGKRRWRNCSNCGKRGKVTILP